MELPKKVTVTEQDIDISWLTEKQKMYYKNLAERLIELYGKFGKARVVFSISGPSGSGKSVTLAILAQIIKNDVCDFALYTVGLDAFHYPNKHLSEKNLRDVKGRFDTYDVEKLKEKLHDFVSGNEVRLPIYSRKLHEPVEDKVIVDERRVLLLIEGLWFLRNDDVWKNMRKYLSYNFFVSGNETEMRTNTIKRHVAGGRSAENAEKFFDISDYKNTQEILTNSIQPDERIEYFKNIDRH